MKLSVNEGPLVNERLSVNEQLLVNEHKTGATRLVSLPFR